MRRAFIVMTLVGAAIVGMAVPAQAQLPPGNGMVSDAAFFPSVLCTHDGQTVSADLVETPGGGASVWLPNGQHLVTYTFQLVENGTVISDEKYGSKHGITLRDQYICTATGFDPQTGQVATGTLVAYPAP